MNDLSERFAARDRVRKAIAAQRTPAERMELMFRLQREARAMLAQCPEALDHFMRRNFRNRVTREDSHATG